METINLPSLSRRYHSVRPEGRALPAVIFLHGTGATPEFSDEETGWSGWALREQFALILAEGTAVDPHLPPKFLTNPLRWNDGSTSPGDRLHVVADDVDYLDQVLDDAISRFQLDPERIYLTGFSNGAGMVFRYASARARRIAALAPVAGYCWVKPKPERPLPTLYLIGDADPLIPWQGGTIRLPWGGRDVLRPTVPENLERWAEAIGCAPSPLTLSESAGIRTEIYPGATEFRAMIIEGMGHHWPGGKGSVNPRIAGRPSRNLDACAAIWDFFRNH